MSNQNFKTGTIADVGYAEYKGKETFYLVLQDDKGNLAEPIRGKGLEEAFNKAGDLKKGDVVNLKDFGIDDNTKKRIWEIERHEPYQDLKNSIELNKSPEKEHIQVEETKQNEPKNTKKSIDVDGENLPFSIKNNYVAITKNSFMGDEKINYYDKSDPNKVDIAFEDRKTSLNTSRHDEKTINAMLDLAESKGWKEIKIKGEEQFKQKVWLEASLRGIGVKGYEPSEKDLATLATMQELRTQNKVEVVAIKEPELSQVALDKNKPEPTPMPIEQEQKQEQDKNFDKQLSIKEITPLEPVMGYAVYKTLTIDKERFVDDKDKTNGLPVPPISKSKDIESEKQKVTTPAMTDKEIRQEIRQITQDGYRAGTISNRDDVVKALTERGYEVVKETDKTIRLKTPYDDKHLTLKGEMFTKDYDALKQLKENLEPDNIKQRYPNMSDVAIAQVTAWKDYVLSKPQSLQSQQNNLSRLESSLKDIANGKDLGMPNIPANEVQPNIEVRTPDSGSKSRSR